MKIGKTTYTVTGGSNHQSVYGKAYTVTDLEGKRGGSYGLIESAGSDPVLVNNRNGNARTIPAFLIHR